MRPLPVQLHSPVLPSLAVFVRESKGRAALAKILLSSSVAKRWIIDEINELTINLLSSTLATTASLFFIATFYVLYQPTWNAKAEYKHWLPQEFLGIIIQNMPPYLYNTAEIGTKRIILLE